jgi:hypothetical protein
LRQFKVYVKNVLIFFCNFALDYINNLIFKIMKRKLFFDLGEAEGVVNLRRSVLRALENSKCLIINALVFCATNFVSCKYNFIK